MRIVRYLVPLVRIRRIHSLVQMQVQIKLPFCVYIELPMEKKKTTELQQMLNQEKNEQK